MILDFFRQGAGNGATAQTAAPAAMPQVKAARMGAWPGAGRVAPVSGVRTHHGAALVSAGFLGNPVGFRAVRLIAEAAAALPLMLQDAGQRFDTHPVLDVLRRPNAAQGRAEFLEALYGHLLLSGNAFIEAVGAPEDDGSAATGAGGLPRELHVLRADRMRVIPGADGWPVAYEYMVGGHRHRFALGTGVPPVCHIRSFHPQDDHYGLSPLRPAAGAVEVHNAASRWSKALLDNAARPSGAIVFKGAEGQGVLSPDQYDRLLSEMEAHHQGARNAGRPMLLEGGLDWKPMGFSPSDMEFHRTKEAAAREIALAFGVPPMMLGLPGDATYANYQEANRAFYRLTVLPLAARVTAALAEWLCGFAGGRLRLAPDPDQVPALAIERDAQWARVAQADFLTTAEKRALLGLPPLAAGTGTAAASGSGGAKASPEWGGERFAADAVPYTLDLDAGRDAAADPDSEEDGVDG